MKVVLVFLLSMIELRRSVGHINWPTVTYPDRNLHQKLIENLTDLVIDKIGGVIEDIGYGKIELVNSDQTGKFNEINNDDKLHVLLKRHTQNNEAKDDNNFDISRRIYNFKKDDIQFQLLVDIPKYDQTKNSHLENTYQYVMISIDCPHLKANSDTKLKSRFHVFDFPLNINQKIIKSAEKDGKFSFIYNFIKRSFSTVLNDMSAIYYNPAKLEEGINSILEKFTAKKNDNDEAKYTIFKANDEAPPEKPTPSELFTFHTILITAYTKLDIPLSIKVEDNKTENADLLYSIKITYRSRYFDIVQEYEGEDILFILNNIKITLIDIKRKFSDVILPLQQCEFTSREESKGGFTSCEEFKGEFTEKVFNHYEKLFNDFFKAYELPCKIEKNKKEAIDYFEFQYGCYEPISEETEKKIDIIKSAIFPMNSRFRTDMILNEMLDIIYKQTLLMFYDVRSIIVKSNKIFSMQNVKDDYNEENKPLDDTMKINFKNACEYNSPELYTCDKRLEQLEFENKNLIDNSQFLNIILTDKKKVIPKENLMMQNIMSFNDINQISIDIKYQTNGNIEEPKNGRKLEKKNYQEYLRKLTLDKDHLKYISKLSIKGNKSSEMSNQNTKNIKSMRSNKEQPNATEKNYVRKLPVENKKNLNEHLKRISKGLKEKIQKKGTETYNKIPDTETYKSNLKNII